MRKQINNLIALGIFLSLVTTFGCTKTFVVQDPAPSSIVYDHKYSKLVKLKVLDKRSKSDKSLSAGTLNVVLKNMENEIQFLGVNLEEALKFRGINAIYSEGEGGEIVLTVRKYRIRNLRTTGFSPYWTFTTFSGEIEKNGQKNIVTFYFKRGKVPVWAFKEVEEPCYNVPVSLMVKEIASKIDRYYFGLQTPNRKVTELVNDINNNFDEFSFLKALELGYTNNPSAIAPLVELTNHSDSMVRACAICSLGVIGATDQFEFLKNVYQTRESIEKYMALKSIGDLGTPESVDFIRSLKESDDYKDENIQEIVDLYI